MTKLEEFQQLHGPAMAAILANPAFSAGMIHTTIEAMVKIKNLTDMDITANAVVILADLRGRLLHEASLFALGVPAEVVPEGDPLEDYPDAVEEHFLIEQQRNAPPKL